MYICEACGSTSDQPGVCNGPPDGYPHEPTERVNEATSVSSTAPPSASSSTEPLERVDPANGTEIVHE